MLSTHNALAKAGPHFRVCRLSGLRPLYDWQRSFQNREQASPPRAAANAPPLCSNENERTANAATAKHRNVCVEHHTTIAIWDGDDGGALYVDEVKAYSIASKIV